MYEQLYRDRLEFAKKLAELVNSSTLPAFIKLDILAAMHQELTKVATEEELKAMEENTDADTSV